MSVKKLECLICVDMGTTNTRAWLHADERIVAHKADSVGIRDAAQAGNNAPIRASLKGLLEAMRLEANALHCQPTLVLGAGMITSSLGLVEVEQVIAPAGPEELARSIYPVADTALTNLPIWLIPGVRTGPKQPTVSDLDTLDLIRGEETLCVGLSQLGVLFPGSTLLNLGSHWKAITLDDLGRIGSSFSTLSGEMIHAVQQTTVLSSSLPPGRFSELDLDWLEKGVQEEEVSGISRALFCVRILDQRFKLNSVQLSSFLLGAFISLDLQSFIKNKKLGQKIVVAGTGALAEAWKWLLEKNKYPVTLISAEKIEAAFIAGLIYLAELRGAGARIAR